jgi:hypothetical protein
MHCLEYLGIFDFSSKLILQKIKQLIIIRRPNKPIFQLEYVRGFLFPKCVSSCKKVLITLYLLYMRVKVMKIFRIYSHLMTT